MIMPSGGVSPDYDNLKSWFDAGVTCVGLGSQLFPAEEIKLGKFDEIEKKVKEAFDIIQSLKKNN
jgi:2-dehydro-3-deoxyphosphogluconate aldolase/(4S)-4-hydroxy-2-oxoglutarate aldolase